MGFLPGDTEEYASEDLKKELRWIIQFKNSDVMNREFLVEIFKGENTSCFGLNINGDGGFGYRI